MSGVVLLNYHFLENCPSEVPLYDALESAATSQFGGYSPRTMHYRGRPAEVSHCALYIHVTTEGEYKETDWRRSGKSVATAVPTSLSRRPKPRLKMHQHGLLSGTRMDGTE